MFERKKFKSAALAQLKGRWKIPVLATLLTCALLYIFAAAMFGHYLRDANFITSAHDNGKIFIQYNLPQSSRILGMILCAVTTIFTVALLSVHNTMLKESRQIYFSDFTNGLNQWWQSFRGGLWFCLWVFLWSLLFFIPGIVKAYSYSMMFFIMSENPEISVRKAMKISKELTRGYKGELFALNLSFLGWTILASITGGIGFIWLVPYMLMTHTNAYQYLKQAALDTNRITLADFE